MAGSGGDGAPLPLPPAGALSGRSDAVKPAARQYGWVVRLLAGSRIVIVVGVLGLLAAATTLIVYAALVVGRTVLDLFVAGAPSPDGAKRLTIAFVELTDAFLLGAVLLIVALGLYELFIDPNLPVPPWLRVSDLDELKGKLVGVLVVLLGVTFLPYVVDWDGRESILHIGLAVAAVISAFAVQALVGKRDGGDDMVPPRDEATTLEAGTRGGRS